MTPESSCRGSGWGIDGTSGSALEAGIVRSSNILTIDQTSLQPAFLFQFVPNRVSDLCPRMFTSRRYEAFDRLLFSCPYGHCDYGIY